MKYYNLARYIGGLYYPSVFFFEIEVSHEKRDFMVGWVIKGMKFTTQLYRDYFINHNKDPY